jgi:hypothetical protein
LVAIAFTQHNLDEFSFFSILNVMRTFSYQTTGVTMADQIQHRNETVARQNALAQSGGTVVPQFREAGAPTGAGAALTV